MDWKEVAEEEKKEEDTVEEENGRKKKGERISAEGVGDRR